MKTQKSIGRERLAKLATFLYRVPRAGFDMSQWKKDPKGRLSLDKHECNTAGCAIGWAAELFRDEGLSIYAHQGSHNEPHFDGLYHRPAIEAFFNVTGGIAWKLFLGPKEMGPRKVAARIRKFLKTGRVSNAT